MHKFQPYLIYAGAFLIAFVSCYVLGRYIFKVSRLPAFLRFRNSVPKPLQAEPAHGDLRSDRLVRELLTQDGRKRYGRKEMQKLLLAIRALQAEDHQKIAKLQEQIQHMNTRFDDLRNQIEHFAQKSASTSYSRMTNRKPDQALERIARDVDWDRDHATMRQASLISASGEEHQRLTGPYSEMPHIDELKQALLTCHGVNKERLDKEFEQTYQGPEDLEIMLRRLLEKWLSRPALPKSVYDSIGQAISDKTNGRAALVLPEIRSRYDESRHEAIHYVSLPSGASGEIIRIFKPGIRIDGEQVTLALVEVSQ